MAIPNAQALLNAQMQASLASLPTFSNSEKEDKFTARAWLDKVLLHKQAAQWDNAQTITHFRNALREGAIEWFETLECFGVDVAGNK